MAWKPPTLTSSPFQYPSSTSSGSAASQPSAASPAAIKCSDCGQEVLLDDLGSHICAPAPSSQSTHSSNSVPGAPNSNGERQPPLLSQDAKYRAKASGLKIATSPLQNSPRMLQAGLFHLPETLSRHAWLIFLSPPFQNPQALHLPQLYALRQLLEPLVHLGATCRLDHPWREARRLVAIGSTCPQFLRAELKPPPASPSLTNTTSFTEPRRRPPPARAPTSPPDPRPLANRANPTRRTTAPSSPAPLRTLPSMAIHFDSEALQTNLTAAAPVLTSPSPCTMAQTSIPLAARPALANPFTAYPTLTATRNSSPSTRSLTSQLRRASLIRLQVWRHRQSDTTAAAAAANRASSSLTICWKTLI